MNNSLTLLQLNSLVRQVVEDNVESEYWVEAEISSMSVNRNGHCYLELVEKDKRGTSIIAKAKAIIYSNLWMLLAPAFASATGESLRAGLKILVSVRISFHELYGYALQIYDIDPTYTIGDLAQHRQMIIKTLKEEGIFDLNKELQLPKPTRRIAVISSATAAGYGDFCNQLQNNQHGYTFSVKLFPAIMQGAQTEQSVIAALDAIAEERDNFDCVVIIRGGGATSDLASFDSLPLAECVANFPLPVITGIGHERDDTVLDMISFHRVKTPTAAAEFLIAELDNLFIELTTLSQMLHDAVSDRITSEREHLNSIATQIPMLFSSVKLRQEATIEMFYTQLKSNIQIRLKDEQHQLELLRKELHAADPVNILKRGFSLTLCNGKAVRSVTDLKEGDEITTRLVDGEIKSSVTNTK